MGCVISKDYKTHSAVVDGTCSWDKSVYQKIAIPTNRSVKAASKGRSMATVFSFEHSLFRRHSRSEDSGSGSKAFMQTVPEKESYSTGAWFPSKFKQRSGTRMSLGVDKTSGALVMSRRSDTEVLADPKHGGSTTLNVPAINVLELQKGLVQVEPSASAGRWQSNHTLPFLSLCCEGQQIPASSTVEPVNEAYELFATGRITRRLGSKIWPCVGHTQSCAEDTSGLARQGKRSLISNSLSWKTDSGHLPLVTNTGLNGDVEQFHGPVDGSVPRCIGTATPEDLSLVDYGSSSSRKALSLKYMLPDACSEIPSLSTEAVTSDGSCFFALPDYWLNLERSIWSSSPAFLETPSFKDWLQDPPKPVVGNSACNSQSSVSDSVKVFQFLSEAPKISKASHTKAPHFLCMQSVLSQWPCSLCPDKPHHEDFGGPIFDPKMVDSFETAIALLSEEEWEAIRAMEDSPRVFLQLVGGLKKCSSNCARSRKDNTGNRWPYTITAEFDSRKDSEGQGDKPESRNIVRAVRRHISFEMGSCFSQVRSKDNQGMPGVVFYSATSEVWAKAYKDCNQVRSMLHSLEGIRYDEKSVSELEENERELRYVLGIPFALVPTICLKGMYLVGIDSISYLHKKGLLGFMLQEASDLPPEN